MTTWLVTGGAGYIGSHVVRAFQAAGIAPVVLDDLSTGRREFVPPGVPLVAGSIGDADLVRRTLTEHGVDGVVHLGALKYAGVSVGRPLDFYRVNVEGTRVLLEECAAAGVDRLVFSSSAAVYGTPDVDTVDEATPPAPESPYGETKLVGEWLCADVARAQSLSGARPLRWCALRYFNVVGSGDPAVYDVSPHNLFPLVLSALSEGRTPIIHGTDYSTPDGTCVRDYLHVADVASAHVAAAQALDDGRAIATRYNLGRGSGVSVREIMTAVARVTGREFTPDEGPRRPGDPDRIVASSVAAERDLRWQATHDLDDMVESAWVAWQAAADARLG